MEQKIVNKVAVIDSHAANLNQAAGELGGMLNALVGNQQQKFPDQAEVLQRVSVDLATSASAIEKALKHPGMAVSGKSKDQPNKEK